MKTVKKCFYIFLVAALSAAIFSLSGCLGAGGKQSDGLPSFSSYRDIPGVTKEEINAIEALLKQTDSFVYGMTPSTEAFLNRNGEVDGYAALICEWLSELFGVPFIPGLYTGEALLEGLESGAIDFTGDLMSIMPGQEANSMTGAIAKRSVKYFRIAGSEPLSEIAERRRPRYALLQGSPATFNVLRSTRNEFSFVFIPKYIDAYELLQSGKVDALVAVGTAEALFDVFSDVVTTYFIPLIDLSAFLMTRNRELTPLISVVQKALESGGSRHLDNLHRQGHQKYLRHKFYLRLSEEERAYLHSNPVIPLAAQYDNYPASFYNARDREWQGICFDVLREVELLTGLKFKIIHDNRTEWPVLLQALEDGDAHILSELMWTRELEGRFLWPDASLYAEQPALISKSEYPNINVHEVFSAKVGLSRGTVYTELFRQWFPTHRNTIEYNNRREAFAALTRGEVDMVMNSIGSLLYLTNYLELAGYKANITFENSFESRFGFHIEEADLRSIVDKALDMIDTRTISNQWLRKTFDYRAKLAEAQRPWIIGAACLLLLILILVVTLFQKNRAEGKRLEEQVRERTATLEAVSRNLESALKEADVANKSKSNFLAAMSHEIRTPMNAILGITEILIRDETTPHNVREGLNKIYNSGDLLLKIINDILDLSRIEAGKLELDPYKYETASLIYDTVMLNIVRTGSKPIEFRLFVDENMPSLMIGDELRIKQILNNLLSNAFKYTEEGEIKLSFTVETGHEESDVTLVFSLSDTGQGMTEEQVGALFDEYSRFHFEANRTTEGTGLGMSIVRNLVQLMNGEIFVESQPHRGTTVTVRLPQRHIGSDVLGKELSGNLQNFQLHGARQIQKANITYEQMPYGSVLIVDDVESNSFVAKGLMAPYGLSIDTVTSGFDAIDKIKAGNVYDVVFMDHMMPKMDGVEATKIIRAHGYTQPIIALTANAGPGRKKMYMAHGFDGFISKPIDIRHLNAVLRKFVRNKRARAMEAARLQMDEPGKALVNKAAPSSATQQLVDFFVRDAVKIVTVLETLVEKHGAYEDEDIAIYTTGIHAMKSALANIGEMELSAFAGKLEQAGQEKNTGLMSAEIPMFLRELRVIIEKLSQQEKAKNATSEDYDQLHEKLTILKKACKEYDKKTAKDVLFELRQKTWSLPINELLGDMAENLMSGDFDEVSLATDRIIKML